jgi:hypothetical protein
VLELWVRRPSIFVLFWFLIFFAKSLFLFFFLLAADPQKYGQMGGEAAKEKGAGIMSDPAGFGQKGGETAKERGAGIMADPAGYGSKGGQKGGRARGGQGEEEE